MPNYCYNKIIIKNFDTKPMGEWYKASLHSRQVDYYSKEGSESKSSQIGFYENRNEDDKLSYYELKRLIEKGIPENSVMMMTCPIEERPITNHKCNEKWGTKWDFNTNPDHGSPCEIDIEDDKITIQGETAWSPPIKWLKHIENKFRLQEVECFYREEGMEFAGRYGGTDGISDDDNRFDWNLSMDDDALHFLYQEAESQETDEDDINSRFFDLIENHFRCRLEDEFCGDTLHEWEYDFFIDDFGIEREMERYIDEIKPNMISLEEKLERLEKLEEQLESGEINEGKYLEECNKLK